MNDIKNIHLTNRISLDSCVMCGVLLNLMTTNFYTVRALGSFGTTYLVWLGKLGFISAFGLVRVRGFVERRMLGIVAVLGVCYLMGDLDG